MYQLNMFNDFNQHDALVLVASGHSRLKLGRSGVFKTKLL